MYTSHDAEILSEYYLLQVKPPKVTIFPKHKLQSCNIITPVTYSLPVPNPDMAGGQICSSLVWTLFYWLSFLCNAQNNVLIIQLCLWTLIFAYTTWLLARPCIPGCCLAVSGPYSYMWPDLAKPDCHYQIVWIPKSQKNNTTGIFNNKCGNQV